MKPKPENEKKRWAVGCNGRIVVRYETYDQAAYTVLHGDWSEDDNVYVVELELRRMRNPISAKSIDRIRRLLRSIDFNISGRSRDLPCVSGWFREIRDDLSECRAILETWNRRRKRK